MSRSGRGVVNSVTRLGDFWKFLVTNFITKVAKVLGDFLGFLERQHFKVNNAVVTFWVNFWLNFGYFKF